MPIPGGSKRMNHPLWGSDTAGNNIANQGDGVVRKDSDTSFSVGQLINPTGTAEGSSLPPQQRGDFRVPIPTGFKVQSVVYNSATFANVFTLIWNDVSDNANGLNQSQVGEYRIYAQTGTVGTALLQPEAASQVGASHQSPCTAIVNLPTTGTINLVANSVTFWLRPVMSNGLTLPLNACPTCTGVTAKPFLKLFDGNLAIIASTQVANDTGGLSPGFEIAQSSTSFSWFIRNDSTGGIFMTNPSGIGVVFLGVASGGTSGILQLKDGTAANDTTFTNIYSATASAGAATLPANPEGFIEIIRNGVVKKIPYYST